MFRQQPTRRSILQSLALASITVNRPPGSAGLPPRQHAIVVGSTLGDGFIERRGDKARLRLSQRASQAEYIQWQYRQLQSLCTTVQPPHFEQDRDGSDSCLVYTSFRSELKPYHELFYWPTGSRTPKGATKFRKSIPEDFATILTDPISLMVWYLDDGTYRKDGGACRLATQSFTAHEHTIMQEALWKNFGIKSQIEKWHNRYHGHYYGLMIPTRGGHSRHYRGLFEQTVLKEIPSMSYKVGYDITNGLNPVTTEENQEPS